MKAAYRKNYGPPEIIKIKECQKPELKAGEVLVRVKAATVNRTDCANLRGKPFIMHFVLGLFKPSKSILGTDFAGEIVALAEDVQDFTIGDRVFGFIDTGAESQASFTKVSTKNLFPIPDTVDFENAVASLEGAHYAYSFIHKIKIQSGKRVMVNGATGAIGSALLQFLKQYDVHITVSCNQKNRDLMLALGADKLIDFDKEDFTDMDNTFDYVFDTVGKSTFGKCKKILEAEGVYISSELGPYSQNIFYALFSSFTKRKVIFPIPYSSRLTIPFITKALNNGSFKPVIDRRYELADIKAAYEYVLSGQKTGNVLINMNH